MSLALTASRKAHASLAKLNLVTINDPLATWNGGPGYGSGTSEEKQVTHTNTQKEHHHTPYDTTKHTHTHTHTYGLSHQRPSRYLERRAGVRIRYVNWISFR